MLNASTCGEVKRGVTIEEVREKTLAEIGAEFVSVIEGSDEGSKVLYALHEVNEAAWSRISTLMEVLGVLEGRSYS